MADKKSIMDEILETYNEVERTLDKNAEEILRSTMNEKIDEILETSLNEDENEDEEEALVEPTEEPTEDMEGEESEEEAEEESEEESEEEAEEEAEEEEVEDAIDAALASGEGEDLSQDDDIVGVIEPSVADVDLTNATDEDIIKVFKKLTNDDEIEVVSDTEVSITEPTTGTEYKVEMGGESNVGIADDMGAMDDMDDMDDVVAMEGETYEEGMEGEMVYEIELDESEEESEGEAEEESEEEEPVEEQIANTVAKKFKNDGKGVHAPSAIGESIDFKTKYESILAETKQLKKENAEFKQVIKKFRSMLKETAVFSSNLAHITKLFTENSTSKKEKETIVQRFDGVASLDESKKLYKVIKEELTRNSINEKVEAKLNESATSSSSSKLNENRAYVDASTQKIIDLMNRIK